MTGRHKPYVLKPEFVRGCTMRCVFCALRNQSWAEQDYKYMSMDLWVKYLEAVREWHPKVRFEIANRGEPTIHPEFLEFIRIGRQILPKAQFVVSTNGDLSDRIGLTEFRDWVKEAQRLGVGGFLLDCYTPKRLRDFRKLFEDAEGFFTEEGGKGAHPYGYHGPDWRAIIVKDAVPAKVEGGGRAPKESIILQYHNQGGNAVTEGAAAKIYGLSIPDQPLERMCVRPFREMPMWYDGEVPLCCDDWADKHIVGRFPDTPLPVLWDAYDPARRALIAKNRGAIQPCNKCTERQGQRFGLELNWFGDRS